MVKVTITLSVLKGSIPFWTFEVRVTNCLNHAGDKLVLKYCLAGRARCGTGFAVLQSREVAH